MAACRLSMYDFRSHHYDIRKIFMGFITIYNGTEFDAGYLRMD